MNANTLISFADSRQTASSLPCSGYYQQYSQSPTPIYPASHLGPESYYAHQPDHLSTADSFHSGYVEVDRSRPYCGASQSPESGQCASLSPQQGPCGSGSPLSVHFSSVSPQTGSGSYDSRSPTQAAPFSDSSSSTDQQFAGTSPEHLPAVAPFVIPACSAGYQLPANHSAILVSFVVVIQGRKSYLISCRSLLNSANIM